MWGKGELENEIQNIKKRMIEFYMLPDVKIDFKKKLIFFSECTLSPEQVRKALEEISAKGIALFGDDIFCYGDGWTIINGGEKHCSMEYLKE